MDTSAEVDVNALSWTALNAALLECEDQERLRLWLSQAVCDVRPGAANRALRVYGRYATVRRVQELAELRERMCAMRKTK